jgi:methylmalonyl-CoA/ethylmalonyl-CoA epimerase
MLRGWDYIGIAVNSLDKAVDRVGEVLGLGAEALGEVPEQQVRAALVPMPVGSLALFEPTSPDSDVARFLESRGEGMHHVSFRVDDLAAARAQVLGAGARLLGDAPGRGLTGPAEWVDPESTGGVLVALTQVETARPTAGDLQLHHVTMRTRDRDAAAARWQALFGVTLKRLERSDGFAMLTAWLDSGDGRGEIEFAQQLDEAESGPVARALREFGEGLHATVVETDDPEGAQARAEAAGVRVIVDPGDGFNTLRALHPRDFLGTLFLVARKGVEGSGRNAAT